MKTYRKQTHYEILDVPPGASPFEISQAYRESFELYQNDNMAACSFFPEAERKEILTRLEEAYLILINPGSRSVYDRSLMEIGVLEEGTQYRDSPKGLTPIYNIRRKQTHFQWLPKTDISGVDKSLVSENPLIQEILKQGQLTGQDLKKIRTALGVPLERISQQTKITLGTLEAIEEGQGDNLPPAVYLKGFLKLYAQALQIDDNAVVQAYMKHVTGEQ